MWGKTKQNLSSAYGRSSVMLFERKKEIKMRTISSHLADLSAIHERWQGRTAVGVESWGCRSADMAGLRSSRNEKELVNII